MINTDGNLAPTRENIFNILIQNSQNTLECLSFCIVQILPKITLPNLHVVKIHFNELRHFRELTHSTEHYDLVVKNLVNIMAPNLRYFCFSFYHFGVFPTFVDYLIREYPEHFVAAPDLCALQTLPVTIAFARRSRLAHYKYNSSVTLLIFEIGRNFNWANYKRIFTYFPNLREVGFVVNEFRNLNIKFKYKSKWFQMHDFFNTKLEILSGTQIQNKLKSFPLTHHDKFRFLFEYIYLDNVPGIRSRNHIESIN